MGSAACRGEVENISNLLALVQIKGVPLEKQGVAYTTPMACQGNLWMYLRSTAKVCGI